MAAAGRIPFVNTMATFAANRAAEMVKLDIAYNALPVRIAATHAGVSAGHLGPTHHALEDLGTMRAWPNMTVLAPADAATVTALLDETADRSGPVYLRLGRGPTPPLPPGLPPVRLGALHPVRTGREAVLLAVGPRLLPRCAAAVDLLAERGLAAGLLHAHTLKPFDAATLLEWAGPARLVVTVEDHWRSGGLGSLVAETLSERLPRPVLRLGLPDGFVDEAGSEAWILDRAGLSPGDIAAAVAAADPGPAEAGLPSVRLPPTTIAKRSVRHG